MNLRELIHNTSEEPVQEEPKLSKEEYAAQKQAEREEAWAHVDTQAEEVFRDDQSMRDFLNFMAKCTRQSTRNLLILYEQNPEITHPRTFDKWAEAGRSVRTGETGYIFFEPQEYVREDGVKASGYKLTKAFDISQTRGRPPAPAQEHVPEEVLAAIIQQSPVRLDISDDLPDKVLAQYIPKNKTIYLRDGMDETLTFFSIAREEAYASFDMAGNHYSRRAYNAQAYCAAYVLATKYGFDTSGFQFDKVCQTWMEKDLQEKRGFISEVKTAFYSIDRNIQRQFHELEQQITEDAFTITEGGKAPEQEPSETKAAKTSRKSKGKEEPVEKEEPVSVR